MTAQEIRESDALRFINTIAKANKMLNKEYKSLQDCDVYVLTNRHLGIRDYEECQLHDVKKLAELVNIPVLVETLSDMEYPIKYYFDFKGTRFFSLSKGDEINERK